MHPQIQEAAAKTRAVFYIDGFNLYHAIDELGQPHLKWISYWALANQLIPQVSQELAGVVWCTAYYPGDEKKRWRHEQMCGAQKCMGVDVALGHYVHELRSCRDCNHAWLAPTEKEGDINVALHLMRDAFLDRFDHAYLLSADSDQVATVRMLIAQFPNKKITAVVPPGRKRSEHLYKAVNAGTIKVNEEHLERAVMPAVVFKPGVANTRRPREYAPPKGWIHPENRPK